MTQRPLSPLGIISICLMVGSLFFFSSTTANENNDKALIVVSSYGDTNQNELDKAIDLYDYLIETGLDSDDIVFLCSDNLTIKDDDPSTNEVEDGFEWLSDNSDSSSDTIVYISDHAHGITSNESYYRFSNGNVSIENVKEWIDDITFSSLAYVTTGNHSGLFGSQLSGMRRVIMSSMAYNEGATSDGFNIARGLETINADRNQDGWITFVEAFYWEQAFVDLYWDQNPEIWLD